MKYILKKEYPGSPKLGNTIDNLENDWIENYPEFWELVVEKDYEILFVITNNNKFIEKVYNQDATIEPYWKIHSVKRLSDGEIFTIGDIVKCEDCKGKITSLEIYDNDIYLNGIDNKMPFGYTLCNTLDCFEIPQKVKQPLFTTEDGVDIFEGDNIYWVNINTFEKVNCNKYNDDLGEISIKSLLSKKYECKAIAFSTKEKAEEYILLNKPCLSVNDIKNTFPRIFDKEKELIKLVKLKIQQSV